MKKKVLIILSIVLVVALSFIAFSETVDELKNRFVTRDEWATYVDSVNHTLASMEENMMISVQDECEYQMFRRDILAKEKLESMRNNDPPGSLAKLQSMEARAAIDATAHYQY